MNREYIRNNRDYLEDLKTIIEHEESLESQEDNASIQRYNEENGTEHDVMWVNTDIDIHPSRLYQLEVNGFLDRVVDTNSVTKYSMSDFRDEVKRMVEDIDSKFQDGAYTVMHEFPSEEELEKMGIFDDVVGYEDVKFLMRRAMSADSITNVILFGPPASAKTVFLMCINSLDDSSFISGKPTSGPGFYDEMFDEKPKYMAIDEVDNMDKEDQKALSDYTEHGTLVETKGGGKKRRMKTNTKTFASANREKDILPEIRDRFIDLHFEPYSRGEFIDVCRHILTRKENKDDEEAEHIAEAVWDMESSADVRKAIQVARLSKNDPEKVIRVVDDYSSVSNASLLS